MPDEPLHLTKAPIVEAVIGIDFDPLPPDVWQSSLWWLKSLHLVIISRLPYLNRSPNLTGADRCHPRTKLVHLA